MIQKRGKRRINLPKANALVEAWAIDWEMTNPLMIKKRGTPRFPYLYQCKFPEYQRK